jgi:hypothetical protein
MFIQDTQLDENVIFLRNSLIELPESAVLTLLDVITSVEQSSSTESDLLASAEKVRDALSRDFEWAVILENMKSTFEKNGICLITGIPLQTSRQFLVATLTTLCKPNFIHNDFPLESYIVEPDKAISSLSKEIPLPMHTDYPFNPPSTTLILCLEEDPAYPYFGVSSLVSCANILNKIEDDGNQPLKDFLLSTRVDFSQYNSPHSFKSATIFEFSSSDDLIVRYHRKNLSASSQQRHAEFLDQFDRYCNELAIQFTLSRGDQLIVDNWHYLHGRGKCTVFYEENQRRSRRIASVWGDKNI